MSGEVRPTKRDAYRDSGGEKYAFSYLVDLDRLRGLCMRFSRMTPFAFELFSYPDGELLCSVTVAQRDTAHPTVDSDPSVRRLERLRREPVRAGGGIEELTIRRTAEGLVTGMAPIIVDGVHLADIVSEPVVMAGADIGGSSVASAAVPVVSEALFNDTFAFFSEMVIALAKEGLAHMRVPSLSTGRSMRSPPTAEELARFFDLALDPICVADLNTATFTTLNPAWTELLGYSEDELLSQPFLNFVHPDDAEATIEVIEKDLKSGKAAINFINRYRCKDGSYRWLEWASHPCKEEERTYAIARDITAQKEAQEELKRQRELARRYLEIAGVIILALDTDGVVKLVNEKGCEVLGYAESEIIGENWFDFIPQRLRGEVRAVFDSLRNGEGEATEYYENRVLTSGGEERIIAWHNRSLKDEQGTITATLSSGTDITERERVLEALKESENKLRSITDHAVDYIFIKNEARRYTFVNRAIEELLGMPKEEILGKEPAAVFGPEQGVVIEELDDRTFAGETVEETAALIIGDRRRYLTTVQSPLTREEGRVTSIMGIVRDDTDRKRAEEALQESEQFLQDLFNAIQAGISVLDTDLRIVRTNHWMERMYEEQMPLVGKKCYEVYQHRQSPCPDCPTLPTIETGEMQREVVPYPSAEEPTGWMELSAFPLEDEDGNVTRVIEYVKDITERKRAERTVRESKKRLDLAMDAGKHGFWDWDLTTDEVYFDPRYYRMAGYEPDAFPHRLEAFQQRVHPDDIDHVMDEATKHLQGKVEQFRVEFRFCKHSGEWMWIKGQGEVVERDADGTPTRFVGTHTDITDRKCAEEEIRSQKERMDHIIDGTNVGTWEWNVQTGETIFNERWANIIGYTLAELSPVSIETWRRYVHPEDRIISDEALEKHFAGELDHYDIECRMKHRNGMWVWVHDRGRVISWTDDGKPLWMFGTHSEITERKRAEQQLQRSLAEKKAMLREIHHRVKNNLQIVSSLLTLQSQTIDDTRLHELFLEAQNRIRTMALIHVALYRSDDLATIDFAHYIPSLVNNLRTLYPRVAANCDIRVRIEDVALPIDRAIHVGLIVNELISNSLKHAFLGSREGTISIHMRTVRERGGDGDRVYEDTTLAAPAPLHAVGRDGETMQWDLRSELELDHSVTTGPWVLLRVADDGVGLPPTIGIDTPPEESLGLEIVSMVLQQIGGRCSIDRENGTAFTIVFPLLDSAESGPPDLP